MTVDRQLDQVSRLIYPAGNYLLKVNNETVEQGVKYVKS